MNNNNVVPNETQTKNPTPLVAAFLELRAALEGARASVDAHGELVAPEMAWGFLQTVCDDTEGETYGFMSILPDAMPTSFPANYARLGQGVLAAKEVR